MLWISAFWLDLLTFCNFVNWVSGYWNIAKYAFSSIDIFETWEAIGAKLSYSILNSPFFIHREREVAWSNNETNINVQRWASVYSGLSHFINCCKTCRFTHFQKSISSKLHMRFAWKFLYLLTIILYVIIRRTSC